MATSSLAAIVPPAQWTKVHHAVVSGLGRALARRLKISYKALLYKIRMYDLGTSPPGKSPA